MASLDTQLDRWVDHDLISTDQATAIRAFERRQGVDSGRIPLVAEAAGYVGSVLAIVGLGVLLEDVWANMTAGGFLVLSLVVSALLGVAGWALRDNDEPAAQRLADVTWFLSASGVAMSAALYGNEMTSIQGGALGLIVAVPVTIYAALLWRVRPHLLQLLAMFGGASGVVGSSLALPDTDLSALAIGVTIIAFGAAWTAASGEHLLRPVVPSTVVGLITILVGSQVIGFGDDRGAGLIFAAVVAAAMVAAGVALERPRFLGAGAVAVFLTVPQLIFHFFADSIGAPIALLLTGIALLAAALALVRLKQEVA